MKICHVLSAGYGCGQVVVDLLKAGVAAGHDMTLVYTPLRVEPRLAAVFEGMRDRVRVHLLPMTGEIGVSDLSCFWSLYRLLRREGPFDVIHSHASKAGALARLAGLLLPRAVQIYTPQGFSTMSAGSSRAYGWIEFMLSVIGTRIICVSFHEKSHGRELGIADNKLPPPATIPYRR